MGEDNPATLRELRELSGLTQVQVAERLGVNQPEVSRIEARPIARMRIGQITGYIEALGGHLEIVLRFGDDEYVVSRPREG